MYDVYTDKDFQEELLKGLKQRVLDQKFLYTQEGAQIYYELTDQKYKEKEEYTGRFMDKSIRKFIPTDNRPSLLSNQHFLTDFIKTHSCRDSPCCIISLGCGDARQEALLLTHLSQTQKPTAYFAIDSSKSSLELAQKKLENINIPKTFIHADFTTQACKHAIEQHTQDYPVKVFSLL